MARSAAIVKLAHARRCRCDVSGPLSCAECGGLVHVVSPRAKRAEFARDAATEAARGFLAAQLRLEKAKARGLEGGDLEMYRDDALQTLRDALASERRTRG